MKSVGEGEPQRGGHGSTLLIVVLLAMLVAAGMGGWHVWQDMRDTAIGTNGLVALVIGGVLTLLIGGGLMALVFISSRRGYDDRMGRD